MKVEVSLSPALYPFRTVQSHHVTVAIDVLRATTAVCAALQAGCEEVVPLDSLDALSGYREQGFHLAAERNGSKVGDAEYGNSPTEYLRHDLSGVRLAYSTTNGTVTILRAADAEVTLVGAFANLSALVEKLRQTEKDIVLLCSGWKNDFCIEDTLVAGAIVERMAGFADPWGDASHMALRLWQQAKDNPYDYCEQASHVHRLRKLGAEEDIRFAFVIDSCPVVPILDKGVLRKA